MRIILNRPQDSQLWLENGDCLVHFYAHGTSQRGPSLKIDFKDVEKLESAHLMKECLRVRKGATKSRNPDVRTDSGIGSPLETISEVDRPQYELYLPSPHALTRDKAFAFHLSTRNFFAYAVGRPVVGERLSSALAGLWDRLRIWAPKATSASDLISYLGMQGYLNFTENPEHALACLKFAESAKLRDVFIDAFVHCAGMHERLFLSPEYPGLSNTTNARITRASLEMDLHIARVVRAVSSFLEEELGTEHLGLSKPARDHLDHFRSFLHAFYVDKLGYFPPRATSPWDKRPWKAMLQDFQALYEYLVDKESTCDMTSAKALTGGICVTQNLRAYDQRHSYDPLPHPLPLLPQQPPPQRRKSSQKGLRALALVAGATSIPDRKYTSSQSLSMATNCLDENVMLCQLVQEYQRFERQRLAMKLDSAEARKIRWILIYSVLQMLTSIMKAPKEVKDVQGPSYPLCVLTGGCPPWIDNEKVRATEFNVLRPSNNTLNPDAMEALEGRTSRISIHPDCEAENAEDFFAATSGSRTDSNLHSSAVSSPLRLSTQLARTASIRSSVHSSVQALHRSVVGGLSRRSSLRRENPRPELRKTQSNCEIVVENYDDLIDYRDLHSATPDHCEEDSSTLVNSALLEFDFGLNEAIGEPVLESDQLDYDRLGYLDESSIEMAALNDSDASPRGSYLSTGSGYPDSSSRSSLHEDDTPDTDLSSCENSSRATESDSSSPSTPIDALFRWDSHTMSKPARYRQSCLATEAKPVSVNVGCYVPSGMVAKSPAKSISKAIHRRSQSGISLKSNASSLYPEESIQAADIAEVEDRGRRASRPYEREDKFFVRRAHAGY